MAETRGQIELWMLTKMAMLFFIVALAFIMTGFGTQEKKAVCAAQAQAVAGSIASSVSQVVNAPAEDERRIFPLEAVLSVGSLEYSRYVVFITDSREPSQGGSAGRNFVSITVQGRDRDCTGTASAPYPLSWVSGGRGESTGLISSQLPAVQGTLINGIFCECRGGSYGEGCPLSGSPCGTEQWVMQVLPYSSGDMNRIYYLVPVKCKEKNMPPSGGVPATHLFIGACDEADPAGCLGFEGLPICGWSGR